MNMCYIAGAGSFAGAFAPDATDLVIAADGGYEHLHRAGIRVDLLLGDFDSIGQMPQGVPVQRHPIEKDDTDMMLAVKTGLQRGFRRFVLLGALGGRLDHTLANTQALCYLARRGARAFLVGEGMVLSAVTDGALRIPAGPEGYLSVFAMGDTASGVTLEGLKYPLNGATLTVDVPLGCSNQFTGQDATIRVESGTLLVLWYDPTPDLAQLFASQFSMGILAACRRREARASCP